MRFCLISFVVSLSLALITIEGVLGATAAEKKAYLDAHNAVRRKHKANDLKWSDKLGNAAQTWANKCQWKHSNGAVGKWGENLAAGTNLDINGAIKMWADEASQYNPKNPEYSHFTQVVWKKTTHVGCAKAPVKMYVCEYNPPGNVAGQFGQNVSK
ncbi:hypothetical protein D9611_003344 [Ephemerocybe angulata]|uniref:SCP domain-containing protein n=1 Tax=Ephemerocybe angulata TaxID=980116 RepID=A0A8H5C8W5_9AGAR|nr:hypothetical protein D9611_003344 [Tulosesus angulatus]